MACHTLQTKTKQNFLIIHFIYKCKRYSPPPPLPPKKLKIKIKITRTRTTVAGQKTEKDTAVLLIKYKSRHAMEP